MYRSFDEDVLLSPESVVAEVVASAAFDDDPELPGRGVVEGSWCAHVAEVDAEAPGFGPRADGTPWIASHAGRIDAWARHARAANGFGG